MLYSQSIEELGEHARESLNAKKIYECFVQGKFVDFLRERMFLNENYYAYIFNSLGIDPLLNSACGIDSIQWSSIDIVNCIFMGKYLKGFGFETP